LAESGLADFETELRTLCRDGEAILLLDGLDEIPQAGDKQRREQMKSFIASLCLAYPSLRVIVTSRPYAYERDGWGPNGFGRATLEPLSRGRLEELAKALFAIVESHRDGNGVDGFMQALRDAPLEKGLDSNPLFFTLLAALYLNSNPRGQLPATRAELYRRSVDLLLGRWTRNRASDESVIQRLGIKPEELRPILENLACSVTEQSHPGQDTSLFGVGTLLEIAFLSDIQNLRDVADYLTQHAGILVSPGPGELAFVHRSFQEHLAACELTHRQPQLRTPPVPADRHFPQGLLQRALERPDLWENVIGLAADELLAQGRRDELVRLLVEMARPYHNDRSAPQTALLALDIAKRLALLADELDDYNPRQRLRQLALLALVDYERFEPEQRLIAGQLLGSRPGLDKRPGVGIVETQNFASLPDIEWVKIPEADASGQTEFIYQDDERRIEPDFWMARYPITYVQFQTFMDANDGWRNAEWWEGLALNDQDEAGEQAFLFWNHPRERVSWYQAVAFCRWLTAQARAHPELLPAEMRKAEDWRISLPTEWQWEKAARGHDGRRYPWGSDTYQPGYANINEMYENAGPHNLQTTSAVGMYPHGHSPYGLLDLSGNVWEWCLNEDGNPDNIQESGSETRVLRGGRWCYNHDHAAAVYRNRYGPNNRYLESGFRVALSGLSLSPLPSNTLISGL